jgi:hypothetical protein
VFVLLRNYAARNDSKYCFANSAAQIKLTTLLTSDKVSILEGWVNYSWMWPLKLNQQPQNEF